MAVFRKFPRIAKISKPASVLAILLLSACASSSVFTENSGRSSSGAQQQFSKLTPTSEKIGDSGFIIGVLVADEPGNLSDGAANSTYLAAKLAAQTLKNTSVSLIVRRFEPSKFAISSAAKAFRNAGAKIVIGPYSNKGASQLATALSGQNIPVMGLGNRANAASRLYEAGLALGSETATAVAEMKKRKYQSVALAYTNVEASRTYVNAMRAAINGSGIKLTEINIGDAQAGFAALKARGSVPSAVVFATGPRQAASFVSLMSSDAAFAKVAIVGNSGWSTNRSQILKSKPVWYAAWSNNQLTSFAKKFAAVSNAPVTVRGVAVYDLVVMAGVLPKVVPENPYGSDVLSNSQGFKGQSGAFKFDAAGTVKRSYKIVTAN